MTAWLLVMVLHFSVGPAEPLELVGGHTYTSLGECNAAGYKTAEWLTQDFVKPSWRCVALK